MHLRHFQPSASCKMSGTHLLDRLGSVPVPNNPSHGTSPTGRGRLHRHGPLSPIFRLGNRGVPPHRPGGGGESGTRPHSPVTPTRRTRSPKPRPADTPRLGHEPPERARSPRSGDKASRTAEGPESPQHPARTPGPRWRPGDHAKPRCGCPCPGREWQGEARPGAGPGGRRAAVPQGQLQGRAQRRSTACPAPAPTPRCLALRSSNR